MTAEHADREPYKFLGPRVPSSDGVTLQTYDFGGTGPTVLFFHASGFCGPMWEPLASHLTTDYRCIAVDFRAHGRSTVPTNGFFAWSGVADDVLAVIDAFSPDEPPLAVGHSIGGAAIVLAETARPGSLRAAWAFEPVLTPGPELATPDESPLSTGARARRATFPNRQSVLERYGQRPPLNVLDSRCLNAYIDHGFMDTPDGSVTLRCIPENEAKIFEQHRSGAGQRSAQLKIPMTLGVGVESPVGELSVAAAANNPGLAVVAYDDLTHFGPLEDPERIAVDVRTWLDSVAN